MRHLASAAVAAADILFERPQSPALTPGDSLDCNYSFKSADPQVFGPSHALAHRQHRRGLDIFVVGQASMFRAANFEAMVADPRRAQAEGEIRCFYRGIADQRALFKKPLAGMDYMTRTTSQVSESITAMSPRMRATTSSGLPAATAACALQH